MKVLHLSTFDIDGGAARGSFWLHEALKENGVDSAMMVGHKQIGDDQLRTVFGGHGEVNDVRITRGGYAAGLIAHVGSDL